MGRNKRNLTWLSAHFLNGMFPLPLTDIMYLLWITTGKIALVSISFSFPFSLSFFGFSLSPFLRPSTFRYGKRSGEASLDSRAILPRPRCRSPIDTPWTRFVVAGSYPQRYPLRGFHMEIPFNRPPPLPVYVFRDNACLIAYISLSACDNCHPPIYNKANPRFVIISAKTRRVRRRSKINAASKREKGRKRAREREIGR